MIDVQELFANSRGKDDYNFIENKGFMDYLENKYPAVFIFVTKFVKEIKNFQNLAAITIDDETGKPILYLNKKMCRFILEQSIEKYGVIECYNTLTCILLHEYLHYCYRHFRFPNEGFNNKLLNIAMDILIDNRIHLDFVDWRNWEKEIENYNQTAPEKNLPKISLDYKSPNSIFELNEKQLYYFLKETNIVVKEKKIDNHPWSGEQDEQIENETEESKEEEESKSPDEKVEKEEKDTKGGEEKEEKKEEGKSPDEKVEKEEKDTKGGEEKGEKEEEGKSPDEKVEKEEKDTKGKKDQEKEKKESTDQVGGGKEEDENEEVESEERQDTKTSEEEKTKEKSKKDIEREFFKKAFDELNKMSKEINNKPFAMPGIDLRTAHEIKEIQDYDIMQIIKKYINNISRQSKSYTWKKTSRKMPFERPGYKFNPKPGEILIAIDTSGSMRSFIQDKTDGLDKILSEIYTAFKRIAKVYGQPAKLFAINIDEKIQKEFEIKKLEDFKKIYTVGGGGTDYKMIFDKVIMDWKNYAKSTKKVPDLILFITDLEVIIDYLNEPKYKVLSNKLIWLSIKQVIEKPPIGIVRYIKNKMGGY
ncbi:MAG: hypothetical protein N3E50_01985 [Candidatus Goldbacteria bacterium]|nr:hypothetical protein [Candidatus Goldiibacteriota bacterium]